MPGLNDRITKSLECQGSGLTGSYRCSRREQVMLKRIDQYIKQIDIPADIISIQKTAILGTVYPTKSARHLRDWVDIKV